MTDLKERYDLCMERLAQIPNERGEGCFFTKAAKLALYMDEIAKMVDDGSYFDLSIEKLQEINDRLFVFEDDATYAESFANPAYAVSKAGEVKGQVVAYVAHRLTSSIYHIFTKQLFRRLIVLELLLELYGLEESGADVSEWKNAVYDFEHDYFEENRRYAVYNQFVPAKSPSVEVYNRIDPNDIRSIYYYGYKVGQSEKDMFNFIASLPEKDIDAMAYTYTNGYYKGFVAQRIDFSKKKSVQVYYNIGMERMIAAAVKKFKDMGLDSTFVFASSTESKQADFDHKYDIALFLDKKYMDNFAPISRKVFEEVKDEVRAHGGPAVIEVFGEKDFEPESKKEAASLDEKQRALYAELLNTSLLVRCEFLPGEERSFTIISYPSTDIGDNFKEVFADTVKVNTLDSETYKRIHQHLIDALDTAEYVHIKGMNGNETDLRVALHELKDPSKETNFENCLDDVNIPVGEVFTSPKLTGTNGVLNVKADLFLRGLKFKNLKVTLKDGMVESYSCDNFDNEADNLKYMKEELLYNHETLPIGEFAIGTNTTAYVMGIKRNIQQKLDILIAEKTGPHFALGDTCYSHSEDHPTYNPDGKEIVARDNEITAKYRKTEPSKAYFSCHTDITIPYNELGEITAYAKDGSAITIIKEGRFVLPGTEELNVPLDEFFGK